MDNTISWHVHPTTGFERLGRLTNCKKRTNSNNCETSYFLLKRIIISLQIPLDWKNDKAEVWSPKSFGSGE